MKRSTLIKIAEYADAFIAIVLFILAFNFLFTEDYIASGVFFIAFAIYSIDIAISKYLKNLL